MSELGAAEGKRVLVADSAAIYAHPDQLLFVRADTLLAQRFDAARLELIGKPVALAQPISSEGSAASSSSIGSMIPLASVSGCCP